MGEITDCETARGCQGRNMYETILGSFVIILDQ